MEPIFRRMGMSRDEIIEACKAMPIGSRLAFSHEEIVKAFPPDLRPIGATELEWLATLLGDDFEAAQATTAGPITVTRLSLP